MAARLADALLRLIYVEHDGRKAGLAHPLTQPPPYHQPIPGSEFGKSQSPRYGATPSQ